MCRMARETLRKIQVSNDEHLGDYLLTELRENYCISCGYSNGDPESCGEYSICQDELNNIYKIKKLL